MNLKAGDVVVWHYEQDDCVLRNEPIDYKNDEHSWGIGIFLCHVRAHRYHCQIFWSDMAVGIFTDDELTKIGRL
jgi:hypothetical protein